MRLVTGLGCLFLLAACAAPMSKPAPAVSAKPGPPSPTHGLCGDPTLDDRQVTFPGGDGAFLAGYLLGVGDTTLVLSPQASATGCSWLAWAKDKAAAGYRVLALDFNGEGRSRRAATGHGSDDVTAAVAFARTAAGGRVVVVGASRGATASLIAAARVDPPVTAVISLSGPSEYAGESALETVPRLRVPVLYLAAADDSTFAAAAKAMYDATPGESRKLVVVPGQLHGTSLLTITAEGAAEAGRSIEDFLRGL
jgi:pimeloyl-ACP methyl ester carboxylesterase